MILDLNKKRLNSHEEKDTIKSVNNRFADPLKVSSTQFPKQIIFNKEVESMSLDEL